MNELLFGNIKEKEALENLLANNQIVKCNKEIEKYKEEIEEQQNIMKDILRNENIDGDYIEKIDKYKKLLGNINDETGRINELEGLINTNNSLIDEYQSQIDDLEGSLEILKSKIFETDNPKEVIDYQNEIENKNVKINELNDKLEEIIRNNTPLMIEKEYLNAKNNGQDFNVGYANKDNIKNDLKTITDLFNEELEKLDLPTRENIEFCQKKINNREKEIEKYLSRKNNVINAFPNSENIDKDSLYKDLEVLLAELNISCSKNSQEISIPAQKNIFEEDVVEKEEIQEKKELELEDEDNYEKDSDIKEEISLLDEEDNKEEVIEEESSNENEKSEENDTESVSYALSEGESLIDIAEKVYPSKDNWEAIYYFNKDVIDKYLLSNGINSDFDTIKELASDTSIFTGINLEIPTDYTYKK